MMWMNSNLGFCMVTTLYFMHTFVNMKGPISLPKFQQWSLRIQLRRSSKILRGTGTKKLGLRGTTPKNSSVWGHLFTAYGKFCYFFLNFLSFSLYFLYFFLLWILGGILPLAENVKVDMPPTPNSTMDICNRFH